MSCLPLQKEDEDQQGNQMKWVSTLIPLATFRSQSRRCPTHCWPGWWNLFVQKGWDTTPNEDPPPFYRKRDKATIHLGVYCGDIWSQAVITHNGDAIHEEHLGIVKMKGLARSYGWWENIDEEIAECTKHCQGCQETVAESPRYHSTDASSPYFLGNVYTQRLCGARQRQNVYAW